MISSTLRKSTVTMSKLIVQMLVKKSQQNMLAQKLCYQFCDDRGSRRQSQRKNDRQQQRRGYKRHSRRQNTNLAQSQHPTRERNYYNSNNKVTESNNQQRSLQQTSSSIQSFYHQPQQSKLAIIHHLTSTRNIRQLSLLAHSLLFHPPTSQTDLLWCAIQQSFLTTFKPTKNQNEIRSYGKLLYALGKSKKATHNYQTQMALLLPFSSHQSFTQIVTSVSRMGGMSQEFGHIVEKLYWKRKEQFSKLEINLINYVLAKNGKPIDTHLITHLSSFPLKSIVMMLKSYDLSTSLTPQILKTCIPAIIARKQQTNLLDLRGVVNIYSKYLYLDDERLVEYIVQQYRVLARNVNQQALEEIWEYFPQAVNANKLPITFVEQVIKSLKILRTRQRISQRTWKKIAITFHKFENLQIRTQLQKI